MENNRGCGGTLSLILGTIFVVLKATGLINWSWIWVLAPFWIYFAILGILILIIGIFVYNSMK